jgi:DNA-binding transcriptional LysR family regulator
MLELRQLRQFVAVAEELNFRKAALRLNMSQPPLSVAIKILENEVGKPLFERSRHHVRLTTAGRVLLAEARRILGQADRLLDVARQASDGILRFSHIASASLGILPSLFESFRLNYPTIELRIYGGGTVKQVEMLRRGEVDLGLIRLPIDDTHGLKITILCEDRMAIAVPANHHLANRKSVKIEMLAPEPFISYAPPEGPAFEGMFMSACQQAGFYPRVVQHASEMLTKLAFVSTGLGITLIPQNMRAVHIPNVVYLDLEASKLTINYSLALAQQAKSDNSAITAFTASASRVLQQSGSKNR